MDNVNNLLMGQLDTSISSLSTMEPGSAERIATVNEISQLYKLRIEEAKAEADILQKQKELEAEQARVKAELEQKKQDSLIGHVVNGAGIVLPLVVGTVFYGFWNKRWLTFEETGTQTSQQGRQIGQAAARFFKL